MQQRLGAFVVSLGNVDRIRAIRRVEASLNQEWHQRFPELLRGCGYDVLLIEPKKLLGIEG